MEGSWVRCLQHKPVCQRRVDGQAALPVLLLGVMTGWKTTSSCLFVLLSFCMKPPLSNINCQCCLLSFATQTVTQSDNAGWVSDGCARMHPACDPTSRIPASKTSVMMAACGLALPRPAALPNYRNNSCESRNPSLRAELRRGRLRL